ncbi:ubiquitin-related domain-containing protein [Cytidiella melzeri]|nr:ubiquitin-related domain-containing protein [Cytidiella melzeri]
MTQEQEDMKPKLSLTIDYEGKAITIKVRSTTVFKKIFEAAEARFGIQRGTFKFFFEGKRLHEDQTPAELNMENEDIIDAHLEQLGGSKRTRRI